MKKIKWYWWVLIGVLFVVIVFILMYARIIPDPFKSKPIQPIVQKPINTGVAGGGIYRPLVSDGTLQMSGVPQKINGKDGYYFKTVNGKTTWYDKNKQLIA